MVDTAGPVIVITGAAGALGAVVTAQLVARGLRVAALDVPEAAARLDTLAQQLGADRVLPLGLDVLSPEAWTGAISQIEARFGAPEGAVLIAGGFAWTGPLHSATDDAWERMIRINAETALRSLRALLPGLVARRRGSVVLVGARPGARPFLAAGMSSYAASKAAVLALTQSVAAEVLDSGVRVNSVLPSTLDTPRNRADMPEVDPSRWVTAESLAGVITFLLSDAARDISGAEIPVYGRA